MLTLVVFIIAGVLSIVLTLYSTSPLAVTQFLSQRFHSLIDNYLLLCNDFEFQLLDDALGSALLCSLPKFKKFIFPAFLH